MLGLEPDVDLQRAIEIRGAAEIFTIDHWPRSS